MYTITLADGTKIKNLDMNGTNYVSEKKIDESIFTETNLKTVTISDGETEETYSDWEFTQQMEWADGTFYLAFHEKTEQEKLIDTIKSSSTSITDIQEALTELYEMIIGG
jgi:hypothetical protein